MFFPQARKGRNIGLGHHVLALDARRAEGLEKCYRVPFCKASQVQESAVTDGPPIDHGGDRVRVTTASCLPQTGRVRPRINLLDSAPALQQPYTRSVRGSLTQRRGTNHQRRLHSTRDQRRGFVDVSRAANHRQVQSCADHRSCSTRTAPGKERGRATRTTLLSGRGARPALWLVLIVEVCELPLENRNALERRGQLSLVTGQPMTGVLSRFAARDGDHVAGSCATGTDHVGR